MLSITRFRLRTSTTHGEPECDDFLARASELADLLRASPGCLDAVLGRNLDDPELWVLQSRWEGPGAWRRALSATRVKVCFAGLGPLVLDEPSAYETIDGQGEGNLAVPRSLG